MSHPHDNNVDEFEVIAVTRDLIRRPEVKTLAFALAQINSTTGQADKENIPPLYVMLAHRLLTNPHKRQAFLALLDMLT